MNDLPVVGPKSAAELRAFVDHPEPPLAEISWIEAQIGILSIKPSRNRSAVEAGMLVNAYIEVLKDYSRVDLGYAFGRLMRENKWFPDVSEIVELAEYPVKMRDMKRIQAQALVMKHDRDYLAPVADEDRAKPEEVAELLSTLNVASQAEKSA